jgi:hypothetical protein
MTDGPYTTAAPPCEGLTTADLRRLTFRVVPASAEVRRLVMNAATLKAFVQAMPGEATPAGAMWGMPAEVMRWIPDGHAVALDGDGDVVRVLKVPMPDEPGRSGA